MDSALDLLGPSLLYVTWVLFALYTCAQLGRQVSAFFGRKVERLFQQSARFVVHTLRIRPRSSSVERFTPWDPHIPDAAWRKAGTMCLEFLLFVTSGRLEEGEEALRTMASLGSQDSGQGRSALSRDLRRYPDDHRHHALLNRSEQGNLGKGPLELFRFKRVINEVRAQLGQLP